MGAGGDPPELYRLSWFENGDRLEVAAAANRLAASGREVWRCPTTAGRAEAGDYLVGLRPALARALPLAGIAVERWADKRPPDAYPIKHAHIAVLAGQASAYPYYGYYALALARLGLAFSPVDGDTIAAGGLEGENVAVLPGGFSNWGLDVKEGSLGADVALRRFLLGGGAAIASCGGSYYLSRGRPAWLGVVDARPLFTQEYLRTGVGVTTCRLEPGQLRLGLPPTLEIPYYHGPVFDELGPGCTPLATFRDLYGHGRLFIDNPLSADAFSRHMEGRVAVLRASGGRGAAVLFSPHPEMGDLLRKYMALESYIPRYLPVRGALVMRETLESFSPAESRSFLMVLNAVEDLLAQAPDRPAGQAAAGNFGAASGTPSLLVEAWRARRGAFAASEGGIGELERGVMTGLEDRLEPARVRLDAVLPVLSRSTGDGARIAGSFAAFVDHACASWRDGPERRPAELLLELELALTLMEAWGRLAELDTLVSSHA
jgi:hypothetical protein